jgi:hypothetical protein
MKNMFRFLIVTVAHLITRILLLLPGCNGEKKKVGMGTKGGGSEEDALIGDIAPVTGSTVTNPDSSHIPDSGTSNEEQCCCDAAVFVGNIHFWGIPVIAWRNVGREIASDLTDLGFNVTLNTEANKDAVYQALANPSLKILVIIGHGEKDDTTAIVYMAGDDPTGMNFVNNEGIADAIQQAYNGPHPCLSKVILESCFAGKTVKMTKWQQAFGLDDDDITAPEGRTNGIANYYYYFFKTDYGVRPDPCCFPDDDPRSSIAPVTGSTVTNPYPSNIPDSGGSTETGATTDGSTTGTISGDIAPVTGSTVTNPNK